MTSIYPRSFGLGHATGQIDTLFTLHNISGGRIVKCRETQPEESSEQVHVDHEGAHWVDADTGLVYGMSATGANTHDITEAGYLVHGREKLVWCDAG